MQENGAQFALVSKSDRGAQNEGFSRQHIQRNILATRNIQRRQMVFFVDEAYDL